MRTEKEIKTEILALKALKPVGKFANKTANSINLAIEELEFGVDDTAIEFLEMSDSERDIVNTTRLWKEGGKDRPSKGWGKLVK